MSYEQGTVKEEIKIQCIEPYGGNPVLVTIRPSNPNTEITFRDRGRKASLKHEFLGPAWMLSLIKTIVLRDSDNGFNVRGIEHFLATSYVYGIDNAIVELDMEPKWTYRLFRPFGLALRNTVVFPLFPGLERTLCDRIEEVGVKKEGKKEDLRLKKEEKIDTGKLKLERIEGDDVQVRAITEYYVANSEVVKDDVTVNLVPEEYRRIAHARAFFTAPLPKFAPKGFTRKTGWAHSFPMLLSKLSSSTSKGIMRLVGPFLYLGYGFGHGVNETTSFYPPDTEAEWRNKEIIKGEIAYHTIIDRAGDIIMNLGLAFGARPAGMKLTCKFGGHKDACDFVRDCRTKYQERFYISNE